MYTVDELVAKQRQLLAVWTGLGGRIVSKPNSESARRGCIDVSWNNPKFYVYLVSKT